jgi:hypothetical protein
MAGVGLRAPCGVAPCSISRSSSQSAAPRQQLVCSPFRTSSRGGSHQHGTRSCLPRALQAGPAFAGACCVVRMRRRGRDNLLPSSRPARPRPLSPTFAPICGRNGAINPSHPPPPAARPARPKRPGSHPKPAALTWRTAATASTTAHYPPALPPAAPAAAPAQGLVEVSFCVQYKCGPAAAVQLCGDAPSLGSWRPGAGIEMAWMAGDNWVATVQLPAG